MARFLRLLRLIVRRNLVVVTMPMTAPRIIDLRPHEPALRTVADWQTEAIRNLGLCESDTLC